MAKVIDIDIDFVGKDYSSLNDAVKTAKISIKSPSDDEKHILENFSKDDVKKRILENFLKSVQDNVGKLTIGSSDGKRNQHNKLYDPEFGGEGYFCGIVGVLSRTIEMSHEELYGFQYAEDDENFADKYRFNVNLQIKTRLDVDENGISAKPYFLATMLLRNRIKLNDDTVPSSEDEIYDYLLLAWFKEQLLNAYLKGFYRTYRRFENNDDRLKGSIDIARHIRLNMMQDNGKIAYSFRENTVNNYLNHLIVAAYKHLKKKYYDLVIDNFDSNLELKSIIDKLIQETGYTDIDARKLIIKNFKVINHPFYTEYEELRKTCLRILRGEGISMFDGDKDKDTEGILFYLPDLWEEYLYDMIADTVKSCNCNIEVKAQAEQSIFGTRDNKGKWKYKQPTYPDYVFGIKDTESFSPFMILDAKFKPKWAETLLKPNSISEVLSDYDKCVRDMVSIGANATGVIFPMNVKPQNDNKSQADDSKDDKQELNYEHRISEKNDMDRFYTIPIGIPYISEEGYSKWTENLKGTIAEAMNVLKEKVKKECNYYEAVKDLKTSMKNKRSELSETSINM